MINVGFIGAGNMGFAIMKGVSESELCGDVTMYATSPSIQLFAFDKDNEKLKALLPEDDIALFKFLFTSEGMNLRNNIAHCFFQTKNYSAGTMLLLITALLKLGNYVLKRTE